MTETSLNIDLIPGNAPDTEHDPNVPKEFKIPNGSVYCYRLNSGFIELLPEDYWEFSNAVLASVRIDPEWIPDGSAAERFALILALGYDQGYIRGYRNGVVAGRHQIRSAITGLLGVPVEVMTQVENEWNRERL